MLATTTLIGPGTVELLDAALGSVAAFADLCILIPTSDDVADRDVVHAARRGGIQQSRTLIKRWDWQNDFAAARNESLAQATAAGAIWSLLLDTDERYDCDPPALRMLLANNDIDAYYVSHASGSYTQARLVRLPCAIAYSGRTHEAFPAYQLRTASMPQQVLAFSDEPKSAEQLEHKFRRDLQILEEETAAHPEATRYWFYLGESRRNLRDFAGAILAYDRCAALRGWNEESAWACYLSAQCLGELGQWPAALERCVAGLSRHAGVGELAWLAGFACYQLGRYHDALAWSAMAAATSARHGIGREIQRIGFSHPPARHELPHQLMAYCWDKLGRGDLAHLARIKERDALESRLNAGKPKP